MSGSFLLVGLGNPPSKYRNTRHNAGRLFIEYLLEKTQSTFHSVRQAEIFRLPNFFDLALESPLICARLDCFMNESGPPLKSLMLKENISLDRLIVTFDDFMIPFGSLRYRSQGSAGGHNGMKSILETLGEDGFGRLRIGVGPLPESMEVNPFVLGQFTGEQKKQLPHIFSAAQEGLRLLLSEGAAKAQNFLNKQHI